MPSKKPPEWLEAARAHATKYLTLFVNNPGVLQIVKEFDPKFEKIKDPNDRLDRLAVIAADNWDFRKGRERYEVTETQPMDESGSLLGKIIFEGANRAEMASRSKPTLKHYSIVAILGGANKSPYNRLKFALEQDITYDMLAYLGSEREVLPPEQENTKDYAPGAKTEFDLGKGAVLSLLGDQLSDEGEYDIYTDEWHVLRMERKDGVPIVLLSAPPYLGVRRANTADTYDFLRRVEQESLTPVKSILFTTAAVFRYFQYFDAVREITLRTGADIEIIGFEPKYGDVDFKPSQFLQELKSAVDAAVRLRNAVHGKEEKNEWRAHYYNRFERDESTRPTK